jgi:hypothetical protein
MNPELIEAIIEHFLRDVHTILPAKIIEVTDYAQQKATVQPLIKERRRDAPWNPKALSDMALLQNVPIIFPSGNSGMLSMPVKAGDIVLLVFSERSIDNFLYSDGSKPVDPEDYRTHNYSDAFCIAGLNPFSKALGIHPENTVLKMNSGTGKEVKISLTPSGDLIIDSPTQVIVNATDKVEVNTEVAIVNASTSVTIDSPQTTCTGELRVDGGVSVGNDVVTDIGISHNNHKHIGNLGSPTSPPLP